MYDIYNIYNIYNILQNKITIYNIFLYKKNISIIWIERICISDIFPPSDSSLPCFVVYLNIS